MYKSYSDLGRKEENDGKDSVHEIKTLEEKENLIRNNRVVVFDIYTDWCAPCKQIASEYSAMSTIHSKMGECLLVKENLDLKLTENIRAIPTFQFYKDGRMVDEIVGANIQLVQEKLKSILNQNNSGPTQYYKNSIRKHNTNVYHGNNF